MEGIIIQEAIYRRPEERTSLIKGSLFKNYSMHIYKSLLVTIDSGLIF